MGVGEGEERRMCHGVFGGGVDQRDRDCGRTVRAGGRGTEGEGSVVWGWGGGGKVAQIWNIQTEKEIGHALMYA